VATLGYTVLQILLLILLSSRTITLPIVEIYKLLCFQIPFLVEIINIYNNAEK